MRVVAIDLPGHGASDTPEIAYTMPLFARAIDAVLRDAKVDQAVLAGHSMGTPVVWQFARLYPAKTLALVAVDGSFRAFVTTEADRQRWAARYKGQDYKTAMAGVVDNLIGRIADAALAREIKTEMLKTPQHVASSAAYEMSDPKAYATEPELAVPVLAVYAAAPHWSASYRKAIEVFLPRLDYQTMSGVGHFLMMEKPADFNRRLLAFLRAQGLRS
jgi:pimeloyl-ACP methyl ester carboxylesterase